MNKIDIKDDLTRPLCSKCSLHLCKMVGYKKDGNRKYSNICNICHVKKFGSSKTKHRKFRKNKCEICNFIPIDACQIDIHHIDGNHKNNDLSNLQTLCANCHRLETKRQREKQMAS